MFRLIMVAAPFSRLECRSRVFSEDVCLVASRGQNAAERWKDRDSEYTQNQLEKLGKTQKRKKFEGKSNRQKVAHFVTSYWMETDSLPSWGEIQSETGLSRATVARHMSALKHQGELPDK